MLEEGEGFRGEEEGFQKRRGGGGEVLREGGWFQRSGSEEGEEVFKMSDIFLERMM